MFSAASFGLLRAGGESYLAVGSALILPMTLLLFLRPMPLPYSWAAPPEPLSMRDAKLSAVLLLGLGLYHIAAVVALRRGRSGGGSGKAIPGWVAGNRTSPSRYSGPRYSNRDSRVATTIGIGPRVDESPAGSLVGPVLQL